MWGLALTAVTTKAAELLRKVRYFKRNLIFNVRFGNYLKCLPYLPDLTLGITLSTYYYCMHPLRQLEIQRASSGPLRITLDSYPYNDIMTFCYSPCRQFQSKNTAATSIVWAILILIQKTLYTLQLAVPRPCRSPWQMHVDTNYT